jgi:hypothetical protein
MGLRAIVLTFAVAVFAITGCSVFPGLRVITGQQDSIEPQQTIESIDLVMADKTGGTDPALLLVGDRIEAALRSVDVIELSEDTQGDFRVEMIVDFSGIQTRRDEFELYRRASEVTWRAVLAQNINNLRAIDVTLLGAIGIDTLDNGPSFTAVRLLTLSIDRGDAANYMSLPNTSIQSFQNLIADGTLRIDQPEQSEFYSGTPNHPMFMQPVNAPNLLN